MCFNKNSIKSGKTEMFLSQHFEVRCIGQFVDWEADILADPCIGGLHEVCHSIFKALTREDFIWPNFGRIKMLK